MEIQRTPKTLADREAMRSRLCFNERAQLWFRLEPGDLLHNKVKLCCPSYLQTEPTPEGWVVMTAGEFIPGDEEHCRCTTQWSHRPRDIYEEMSAWFSKALASEAEGGRGFRLGGEKLVQQGQQIDHTVLYHFTARLFLFPLEQVPLDLVMARSRLELGDHDSYLDTYLETGLRGRLELGL